MIGPGTRPGSEGILELLHTLENMPETSGCCGEIVIEDTSSALLRAQWFEQSLSYSLQRTFESACGFIPVLPGSFCAYRWKTLTDLNNKVIDEYLTPFKSPLGLGWVESNMFLLAEDRVRMEKIVKLTSYSSVSCCSGHVLTFVSSSRAYIDGHRSMFKLLDQRRRWINGVWFSMIYSLFRTCNFWDLCRTKHNPVRKLILMFQILYYYLMVAFQWVSVGAYYLGFSMALRVRFR